MPLLERSGPNKCSLLAIVSYNSLRAVPTSHRNPNPVGYQPPLAAIASRSASRLLSHRLIPRRVRCSLAMSN